MKYIFHVTYLAVVVAAAIGESRKIESTSGIQGRQLKLKKGELLFFLFFIDKF